jgi:translation initiation factor 2 subunit 2
MEYASALDRAYDALPERATEAESRLDVPDPAGETDGAFTRLTNLGAIADALGREPEHVHRAIQRELGTNGQFENDRARYNGSFTVVDFDAAIEAYVEEFVRCTECGLPDTVLATEDGVAEKGKYTVFVSGAQEGDVVQAYVESISGNLAFARLA